MQQLYNYTRYFKSYRTYNRDFPVKLTDNIRSHHLYLCQHPLAKTPYERRPLFIVVKELHRPCLIALAKHCGVKLKWVTYHDWNLQQSFKSVDIIGEEMRTSIFYHIAKHIMQGLEEVRKYIIKNEKANMNIRSYASKDVKEWYAMLTRQLIRLSKVVSDNNRTYKLEQYIMETEKLKYRLYKFSETRMYNHTISTIFKERKMLL